MLTSAGDLDRQFVVVITNERHIPKHCPIITYVSRVSQVILWPTDHSSTQQLGLGVSLGFYNIYKCSTRPNDMHF